MYVRVVLSNNDSDELAFFPRAADQYFFEALDENTEDKVVYYFDLGDKSDLTAGQEMFLNYCDSVLEYALVPTYE